MIKTDIPSIGHIWKGALTDVVREGPTSNALTVIQHFSVLQKCLYVSMHTDIHTFLNKRPVSLIRSVLWQGKKKRIVYRTCFFLEHITKQGWHTFYAFHPTASKFLGTEQSKCICTITGGEQREEASKLSASRWGQLLHFTEQYRFYTQSGDDGETTKVERWSRLSILQLVKCGTQKAVLSCGLEAENRGNR